MSNYFYDTSFFDKIRAGSDKSAEIIVPYVVELLHPKSVIDIGCGDGTWLKFFIKANINRVIGIDGAQLPQSVYQIPSNCIIQQDLNYPIELTEKFDLAISLEVAEHLLPKSADLLIDELIDLAPVVLFSAAIPKQDGECHLNEQWQEFWVEKFLKKDWMVFDVVRPFVWNDANVQWWYAQNIFLFASRKYLQEHPLLFDTLLLNQRPIYSLVHPTCFFQHIQLRDTLVEKTRQDDWPLSKLFSRFPIIFYKALRYRLERIFK